MRNFENDLIETCIEAAETLRGKHKEWNMGKSDKEKIYSGEREFVAEVYRLFINKDKSYWNSLFIDYSRPEKKYSNESAVPDIVYRGADGGKAVIEVKVIVRNRKRKSGGLAPLQIDLNLIKSDYDQFKDPEHYREFNKKYLVAAFLGDTIFDNGIKFSREGFKTAVQEHFPDTEKIKVIPC